MLTFNDKITRKTEINNNIQWNLKHIISTKKTTIKLALLYYQMKYFILNTFLHRAGLLK
jgi:hypothetical protein